MVNAAPVTTAMRTFLTRTIPTDLHKNTALPLTYLLDLYAIPLTPTDIRAAFLDKHILSYIQQPEVDPALDTFHRIDRELDAIDDTMRADPRHDIGARALINDLWNRFYPDFHPDTRYKAAVVSSRRDCREYIASHNSIRSLTIEWFYMGCAMIVEPQVVADLERKYATALQTDLCERVYGRLYNLLAAVFFDDLHGDPTVLHRLGI